MVLKQESLLQGLGGSGRTFLYWTQGRRLGGGREGGGQGSPGGVRAGGGPIGSWPDGGDLAGGLLWTGEDRVSGRPLTGGCGEGMWMGVRGWALAAADSSLTRVKLMHRP